MTAIRAESAAASAPSLGRLFTTFLKIAMLSFGGGSAMWSQRVLVEQLRWLTADQFLASLSLCQLLPGPNLINQSVNVGAQFRGLAGAAAALAGVILLPLAIMVSAGLLYFRYGDASILQAVLTGMAAAAAGTTIAAGVKIAQPFAWTLRSALPALVTFVAVGILELPMVSVLAVIVPFSIALAWPRPHD